MRVSVVGTGYVGLVTAAGLAEKGHTVICVDIDPARVEQVNRGVTPIFERGLPEMLERHAGAGLTATTDLAAAVAATEVTLLCVPTPSRDGDIDLAAVVASSRDVGTQLRGKDGYHVVAVKSTVVPGTTDQTVLPELENASGRKAGPDFGVGTNPEFLTEGRAVEDFMAPDRIVVGGIDEDTVNGLAGLYEGFPDAPLIRTDNRTAEMIKYASNALLATAISFANEIADLCSSLGIDAIEVMRGVHGSRNLTARAHDGSPILAGIASYLLPGSGFGGSCLPKDVEALIRHGERQGRPMDLLKAVIGINDRRADELMAIIRRHVPDLQGARITVLGLAFRPDTDDTRVSPAFPLIHRLLDASAVVTAHDPVARPDLDGLFGEGRVGLAKDLVEAVQGADAVVLVTRWHQYRALPELLKEATAPPAFIDGRRMLDKRLFSRYDGIGL
jgi:UDPglucose 6-dehydrogenase